MQYQLYNDYGAITIDDSYIIEIITESLRKFKNDVILWNYRPGILDWFKFKPRSNDLNQIKLVQKDDCLLIDISLIIKFGQSMSNVANSIISDVSKSIIDELGIPVFNINIRYTAVETTEVLVKRDINFNYKYDSKEQDD